MYKITSKILSVILIMVLTISNTLLVLNFIMNDSKAYAMNDELDGQSKATNHKRVEFDAFFTTANNSTSHKAELSLNQKSKLYIDINVKQDGYIKNAYVEFMDMANKKNLNFAISKESSNNKFEKIEDYRIDLKQLDVGEFISEILIEDNSTKEVILENLSKDFKAVFKGIYVDVNGRETEIEKEISLHTDLKSEYKPVISEKIKNYEIKEEEKSTASSSISIDLGNGIESNESLIGEKETLTKASITSEITIARETKELPIEKTNIMIQSPKLEGLNPKSVTVFAKELGYTNGRKNEQVIFGKSNYGYDEKTGRLVIEVKNEEVNGNVWAGQGTDKYIVIYSYEIEGKVAQEVKDLNSTSIVKISTYEKTEVSQELSSSATLEAVVLVGVKNNVELVTKELSKGNIYANCTSDKALYETEYDVKLNSIITDIEGVEKIELELVADKFVGEGTYFGNDTYYKLISVLKRNFENVLGTDGIIRILNTEGIEIGRIDNQTSVNSKGYYEISLIEKASNIKIETSKLVAEGILYLKAKKAIRADLGYSKEELQKVTGLDVSGKQINFKEISTKVNFKANREILLQERELVEFTIELNNNSINSDLYKTPRFTIELPSYVKDVSVESVNLLFAGGEIGGGRIDVGRNENGNLVIVTELEGTQTEFIKAEKGKGTTIILNAYVMVDQGTKEEGEINLYYENENVTNYASEKESVTLEAIVENRNINKQDISIDLLRANGKSFEILLENFYIKPERENGDIEEIEDGDDTGETGDTTGPQGEDIEVEYFYINPGDVFKENDKILYNATIKNITDGPITNVKATIQIPEGVELKEDQIVIYGLDVTGKTFSYDKETRILTYDLGTLNAEGEVKIGFYLIISTLEESVTEDNIRVSVIVSGDGTEEEKSNEVGFAVGKAKLEVSANIENPDVIYKAQDELVYELLIKNTGGKDVSELNFTIDVPKELKVNKMTTERVGKSKTNSYANNDEEDNGEDDEEVEPDDGVQESYNVANLIEFEAESIPANGSLKITLALTVNKIEEKIEGYKTVQILVTGAAYDQDTKRELYILKDIKESTDVKIANSGTTEKELEGNKISGYVWLDENEDGKMDITEEKLEGITIKAINKQDNKVAAETKTNEYGKYDLLKLDSAEYIIEFSYDRNKYKVTTYKKVGVEDGYNSLAIENDDGTAITDTIIIDSSSVNGINMGLTNRNYFDLKLDKTISKIRLETPRGNALYEYSNTQFAKVEINAKDLSASTVTIEYAITVTNEGKLPGTVDSIVDYMPKDIGFSSKLNSGWYQNGDEIYNESLSNKVIKPGESRTVMLTLVKEMTDENTGLVNNTAEIYKSSNDENINDIDSIPGNKVQGEDDMSSADVIISIKTGSEIIYITLIIATITIIVTGIYFIKRKVL